MRIVLTFDKFKGTFTARQVCEIISHGIRDRNPKIEVIQRPMADGGEGSAAILAPSLGLEALRVEVCDLLGRSCEAFVYWQNNRRLAVIESAEVLGVSKALASEENLFHASSLGFGKLLRKSFDLRPQEIWMCLGGTLTADAGWGIASEFGLLAFDKNKNKLTPHLENMDAIHSFEWEEQPDYVKKCKMALLCDVNAQAFGSEISLASFLKQKGASKESIPLIQRKIKSFWSVLKNKFPHIPNLEDPFTGAGGGMSLALSAVFPNLQLEMGSKVIAKAVALTSSFSDADAIVCGEGCLDELSLSGKTVSTVSELVPPGKHKLIGVFGTVNGNEKEFQKKLGLDKIIKIFEHDDLPQTATEIAKISRQRLYSIGQEIADET